MKLKPRTFILDVDGVMTSGSFLYSSDGKAMKSFGPDDHDALKILSNNLNIHFISGDKKGFEISRKRIVEDMNFPLDLVSTFRRIEWIKEHFDVSTTIYMGDGIFDPFVMKEVAYSIAPNNADKEAKNVADFVTERNGGDRAVAEACFHVYERFFGSFDIYAIKPELQDFFN